MNSGVAFIVAPFRSGSTAVWSASRALRGVTAYYEPLHERLPELIANPRPPDPTHQGVARPYFEEYESIDSDWLREAHASAARHAHGPMRSGGAVADLRWWVEGLASAAGPDLAVLQLNRACLAVPTLRQLWPDAPIIAVTRPIDERLASARDQRSQAFDWYEACGMHALAPSLATGLMTRVPRLSALAARARPVWFSQRAAAVQARFERDAAELGVPCLRHDTLREPDLPLRLADLLGIPAAMRTA